MVVLIAAVVFRPQAPGARLLALAPLRALGKISYGLYLWHFPLFLWLDEGSTGQRRRRAADPAPGVTLAVSLLSYTSSSSRSASAGGRRGSCAAWPRWAPAPRSSSLLMASAAASLPVGVPAAAKLPKAPARLAGTDGPCQVTSATRRSSGMAPVGADQVAKFEYGGAGQLTLVWSGSTTKSFHDLPAQAGARHRRFAGLHAGRRR